MSYNNYIILNKDGSKKEANLISPNNIYVNSTDIKDKYSFVNTSEEQGLTHINNLNLNEIELLSREYINNGLPIDFDIHPLRSY